MQRGGRLRPPRLAFSELASGRYVQIRCRRSRVFGPALAAHCGASWCRVPHLLSLLGWDFEHDRAWIGIASVSYTHLRAHETKANLVCRLLLEKKNNNH